MISGTGKSALVSALLDSADDWMPFMEEGREAEDESWRSSVAGEDWNWLGVWLLT